MSFPRKKGICDQIFIKFRTKKKVDHTQRLRNSEEQQAAKTECQLLEKEQQHPKNICRNKSLVQNNLILYIYIYIYRVVQWLSSSDVLGSFLIMQVLVYAFWKQVGTFATSVDANMRTGFQLGMNYTKNVINKCCQVSLLLCL